MNPGWSPAHERTATLPFEKQTASARLDAWQKATEQNPPDKGTATSLPLRFLYWIYERRLQHPDTGHRSPRPPTGVGRCRDSGGRNSNCAIQFDDIDDCSWVRRTGGDR